MITIIICVTAWVISGILGALILAVYQEEISLHDGFICIIGGPLMLLVGCSLFISKSKDIFLWKKNK